VPGCGEEGEINKPEFSQTSLSHLLSSPPHPSSSPVFLPLPLDKISSTHSLPPLLPHRLHRSTSFYLNFLSSCPPVHLSVASLSLATNRFLFPPSAGLILSLFLSVQRRGSRNRREERREIRTEPVLLPGLRFSRVVQKLRASFWYGLLHLSVKLPYFCMSSHILISLDFA
jgi:hypothetical protein